MFAIIMQVKNEYANYDETGLVVGGFASIKEAREYMRKGDNWDKMSQMACRNLHRSEDEQTYAHVVEYVDKDNI